MRRYTDLFLAALVAVAAGSTVPALAGKQSLADKLNKNRRDRDRYDREEEKTYTVLRITDPNGNVSFYRTTNDKTVQRKQAAAKKAYEDALARYEGHLAWCAANRVEVTRTAPKQGTVEVVGKKMTAAAASELIRKQNKAKPGSKKMLGGLSLEMR